MAATDPRIDAYIAKAGEFARPILRELRQRVHTACPTAEETLKWSAPSFTYQGRILAVMAAFKQHVAFNLWHGAKVVEAGGRSGEGMGQFGRLTRVSEIPAKRAMTGYIRQAMKLIDAGGTAGGTRSATPRPRLDPPDDLLSALAANPQAQATFDGFPPGKQRDYVEWIIDAKREDTRQRRLVQAVEWLAEGKSRHWKYQDC